MNEGLSINYLKNDAGFESKFLIRNIFTIYM